MGNINKQQQSCNELRLVEPRLLTPNGGGGTAFEKNGNKKKTKKKKKQSSGEWWNEWSRKFFLLFLSFCLLFVLFIRSRNDHLLRCERPFPQKGVVVIRRNGRARDRPLRRCHRRSSVITIGWWMMREESICCCPSFHAAYSQSYCILQRLPKCWTTSKRTRRPLTISSVLSCPSWQLDQLSVRFHGWRHHLPTCGRYKTKKNQKNHSIHANTARRVYYTIINMLTILNKIIVRAPPPPPL